MVPGQKKRCCIELWTQITRYEKKPVFTGFLRTIYAALCGNIRGFSRFTPLEIELSERARGFESHRLRQRKTRVNQRLTRVFLYLLADGFVVPCGKLLIHLHKKAFITFHSQYPHTLLASHFPFPPSVAAAFCEASLGKGVVGDILVGNPFAALYESF